MTTGLLVSVRDLQEARVVAANDGVDIVDLKDPNNGSLGAVTAEIATEVISHVQSSKVISLSLGELLEHPKPLDLKDGWDHVQFAKLGLAGVRNHPNWFRDWLEVFEGLPPNVGRVAVSYVDHETCESVSTREIIGAAANTGCCAVLLDTFAKSNRNLLDFMNPSELKEIVNLIKSHSMVAVLAGSVRKPDLPQVVTAAPDFVGVRGAVCTTSQRSSPISGSKLHSFVNGLRDLSTKSWHITN